MNFEFLHVFQESENNLVRDVDQGVAENGENRGRTVLTVVTSSELPRASDQNASIKEVLHNVRNIKKTISYELLRKIFT